VCLLKGMPFRERLRRGIHAALTLEKSDLSTMTDDEKIGFKIVKRALEPKAERSTAAQR
jgi:hypothetical protein